MNLLELRNLVAPSTRANRSPLRAIGIDLGTTNSAVAEVLFAVDAAPQTKIRCLEIRQRTRQGSYFHTIVPSVLALDGHQLYVGAGAKDLRARLVENGLRRNQNIFWDCKNEIGVRRTYQTAPPGFRSAKEVAARLLEFLTAAAAEAHEIHPSATVVTVPASFQAAQRRETLEAASSAGIDVLPGALLDEPIAAFLDYLVSRGAGSFDSRSGSQRLAVFDFGGGTCDVALFELRPLETGAPSGVGIAPLSVSRYHRLGGGDIDRAIVVDVLIPQLIEQNGMDPHRLDYRDKSNSVIPALLGCAESLKIGLCSEIVRLKSLGGHEARVADLVQESPAAYSCTLRDGAVVTLRSPRLSLAEFGSIMEPFLDRDLLHPRESEYVTTCSVFAPLRDALERRGLEREEVDYCLLVGGSSLIPQVADAVHDFFSNAKILAFDHSEDSQTSVARGAAWQALAIATRGHGLVRPVASDRIGIKTARGTVELVADGTELPYPSEGQWAECDRLVAPATSLADDVKLRVELCASDDRILFSGIWAIRPMVTKGDPLSLNYRLDANQVLHLRLARGGRAGPSDEYRFTVENPLTSVVNPNATRDKILALEEQMRTRAIPMERQRATVEEIANLRVSLGHREQALDLLANLNRARPDAAVLNRMALICRELGDFEREEKLFVEAARIAPSWGAPLFNLAVAQRQQGRLHDAERTIERVIVRRPDGASLVLKALIVDLRGRPEHERDRILARAFTVFDPVATLTDFELSWYTVGARLAQDAERMKAADNERRRRGSAPAAAPEGQLPEVRSEITRERP